ncbi:MAG: DUF72 domain-containing protein [ANME-2 cluster archaeon]|nr:DUF72 domain-containing protein [ANME-2 cluster archaeon]
MINQLMPDYRIGAGGWGYFRIPGAYPLEAYSRAFDFVEVNSTFYQTPSPEVVDSWVRKVPKGFTFSVRCHRDLTHRYMLAPTFRSCTLLEEGIEICRRLGSRLLVMETPRSFDPNRAIKGIYDLLSSVPLDDMRLVWEIRWGAPGDELVRLMQEFNVVHCVDLSKESGPAYRSDILYSRLFGHGYHNLYQFDDEELIEIDSRVRDSGSESMYLSFHGGRMYKDAARLKVYCNEGRFPRVTKHNGIEALREILLEDARFPAGKRDLMSSQGWKVIDVTGDRRVHASMVLERLEEGIYQNVEDVVRVLGQIVDKENMRGME